MVHDFRHIDFESAEEVAELIAGKIYNTKKHGIDGELSPEQNMIYAIARTVTDFKQFMTSWIEAQEKINENVKGRLDFVRDNHD